MVSAENPCDSSFDSASLWCRASCFTRINCTVFRTLAETFFDCAVERLVSSKRLNTTSEKIVSNERLCENIMA